MNGLGSEYGARVHLDLARKGPAFAALEAAGAVDVARWEQAAAWLEKTLPDGPRKAERIHWLIVPVVLWLLHEVERAPRRPLMAGLSAPQGAGKSTLVSVLVPLLELLGVRSVALSIDDFYLTHEEQLRLAAAHAGNPYLEHRGYPGTHDLELGVRTLSALREGRDVELPCYDKSAHQGRGDRSPHTRPVTGRLDLVLLEGWMLGFTPVRSPEPGLEVINTMLAGYARWHELLDVMVCLRAEDPQSVLRWRTEAEDAARASGRPALSPQETEDFVQRFLPAYRQYAGTVTFPRQLVLTLDASRIPKCQ
jgi:D-glycerate 3-kinase